MIQAFTNFFYEHPQTAPGFQSAGIDIVSALREEVENDIELLLKEDYDESCRDMTRLDELEDEISRTQRLLAEADKNPSPGGHTLQHHIAADDVPVSGATNPQDTL